MADKNQEQQRCFRNSENDDLDRALDRALAKYAAVEPRGGLEERILANLRAEQKRAAERSWRRLRLAVAAVALVVMAVGLAWRSGRTSQPIAKHSPTAVKGVQRTGAQLANRDANAHGRPEHTPTRRVVRHRPQPEAVSAASPKLDVFPSPQPLSEQENILASYVTEYPEHAALLAETRMETLRRDAEEQRQLAMEDRDSQQ